MTYEQMEFDFMKPEPERNLGFDRGYVSVCLTDGWLGGACSRAVPVSGFRDVSAAVHELARGIPGFRDYPWTCTDMQDAGCVVIDFGSWRYFGRADYVRA